jgi:hypothetical protein
VNDFFFGAWPTAGEAAGSDVSEERSCLGSAAERGTVFLRSSRRTATMGIKRPPSVHAESEKGVAAKTISTDATRTVVGRRRMKLKMTLSTESSSVEVVSFSVAELRYIARAGWVEAQKSDFCLPSADLTGNRINLRTEFQESVKSSYSCLDRAITSPQRKFEFHDGG